VTSSGMRPPSINSRVKLKSVWEADGKPISISLNPIFRSCLNIRILRAESIGSISAWLPSRRSTLHQVGGAVRVRPGQARSGRLIGANGRYLSDGLRNMMLRLARSRPGGQSAIRHTEGADFDHFGVRSCWRRPLARGVSAPGGAEARVQATAARARC